MFQVGRLLLILSQFQTLSLYNCQNQFVNDLSTDQHYACLQDMFSNNHGSCRQRLAIFKSRSHCAFTLANSGCRILRYYVSVDEPSSNLETLTKFCLQVYFPSWFEIKLNSQLTCGSRNFFNLVQRILQVPDEAVRKTALKVVQRNAFFEHQENVLIAMLGDNDEEIRMRGVNKVPSIRGNLPSTVSFDNHDLVDSRSEEYSLEGAKYYDTASTVRLFEPPTLDLTVNSYYKMVNLTSCHQQPPVIEHLTDLDIEQCRIRPLQFDHPCHNQCVGAMSKW